MSIFTIIIYYTKHDSANTFIGRLSTMLINTLVSEQSNVAIDEL